MNKTINIPPALLEELQKVLKNNSYKLKHAVLNIKQNNHRYIFNNGDIKLLVEFSNYDKR